MNQTEESTLTGSTRAAGQNCTPRGAEYLAVFGLLGLLLALNLASYNLYPKVWCDEVWFSEPAVNLVKYGSFTTSTWQLQPANTFPAVNCPLYSMALVPWLAAFGTTVLAVRSFNYVLMGLAAFLLWQASWRFGIIKTSSSRLLMLLALHLGYGMSFSYRCSRPDVLALVCLALLLLVFGIKRRLLREFALCGLGAATVWIGFQVALFAGAALFGAWLVLRRVAWREIGIVALGIAVGVCSVLLFLHWKGVLSYFLPMVIGMMGKRYAHSPEASHFAGTLKVVNDTLSSYADDFSALALAGGLICLCPLVWRRLTVPTRRLIVYSMALFFGMPLLFNVTGHWAFYYSYMKFVPVAFAFFAAFAELSSAGEPRFGALIRLPALGALAAALLLGLPMRLALTMACCNVMPRPEIQKMVNTHIRPEDVVCSELDVFFEIKQAARSVYDTFYSSALLYMPFAGAHDFSPEEKGRMTVLVIRPADAERVTSLFGGQWQALTPPFGDSQDYSKITRLPVIGGRFYSYSNQRQNERYQVQIFRRTGEPNQ